MPKLDQVTDNPNFLPLAAQLTEQGVPATDVAAKLGIGDRTYYEWLQYGRKDWEAGIDSKYSKFFLTIKDAKANFVQNNLVVIRTQSLSNWQAAAWLLERRRPKEFSKIEKQYTSTNPIPNEYDNMSEEQLANELETMIEGLNALRRNKGKN
jgi:hypothetical protein